MHGTAHSHANTEISLFFPPMYVFKLKSTLTIFMEKFCFGTSHLPILYSISFVS